MYGRNAEASLIENHVVIDGLCKHKVFTYKLSFILGFTLASDGLKKLRRRRRK